MPQYMTQKISYGISTYNYQRKQSGPHVTHSESGKFTQACVADVLTHHPGIAESALEIQKYKSGQGDNGYTLI